MSILIIGQVEIERIAAAIERARARPIPWKVLAPFVDKTMSTKLMLSDRKRGAGNVRRKYPSENMMLGTYRAAISFEYQHENLMRHLSISSHNPKAIPGPQVMSMVCEAFGFSKALYEAFGSDKSTPVEAVARIWVEEFEPGHMAVNVLELVTS